MMMSWRLRRLNVQERSLCRFGKLDAAGICRYPRASKLLFKMRGRKGEQQTISKLPKPSNTLQIKINVIIKNFTGHHKDTMHRCLAHQQILSAAQRGIKKVFMSIKQSSSVLRPLENGQGLLAEGQTLWTLGVERPSSVAAVSCQGRGAGRHVQRQAPEPALHTCINLAYPVGALLPLHKWRL